MAPANLNWGHTTQSYMGQRALDRSMVQKLLLSNRRFTSQLGRQQGPVKLVQYFLLCDEIWVVGACVKCLLHLPVIMRGTMIKCIASGCLRRARPSCSTTTSATAGTGVQMNVPSRGQMVYHPSTMRNTGFQPLVSCISHCLRLFSLSKALR